LTATTIATTPETKKSEPRFLPEDPKEQAEVLARYEPLVRPAIGLASRALASVDVDPLDKDEQKDGVYAFSALAHQYGATIDAKFLVLVWLLSVVLLRVPQYMARRKKEKELEAQKLKSIPLTPVVQKASSDI